MITPWLWLMSAICFEIAGTTALKISYGLTKLLPACLVFLFYSTSFCSLAISLKTLDIGIAYAIWSAAGTAVIATIGVVYFQEPISITKLVSLFLIIVGVIGLHNA